MIEEEKKFERMVPMNSVLGREFLMLQSVRNKEKQLFDLDSDKMSYDTTPYRRSNLAIERFLSQMIPLVEAANAKMEDSRERIEIAEQKAQRGKHGIDMNRRDMRTIWIRFAIERYRANISIEYRSKLKMYNPHLLSEIRSAWKEFKHQIDIWVYGGHPYDGSQAMHAMIDFQIKCRLAAVAHE